MTQIVGLVMIVIAPIIAGWYVTRHFPFKKWALGACLIAMFAGAFLLIQDRATEITIAGVGTIKASAEKASEDARAIADLRKRIEAQSSTVDLVAQEATNAHRLSAELSQKSAIANRKLEQIDRAFGAAQKRAEELQRVTEFTRTVIAAQNDDRRAFDQLEAWANDQSSPLKAEASSAWLTILDEHETPRFRTRFIIQWGVGIDPPKPNLPDLRKKYELAPVPIRPAIIEYVWNRQDLPKKDRMAFLAEVLANDTSLDAAAYAGRLLSEALGAHMKSLAVKGLLQAWEEKKASVD